MGILVNLIVAILIGYVIYIIVVKTVPEPPQRLLLLVMGAIAIIYLLGLLVGYAPGPADSWFPRK